MTIFEIVKNRTVFDIARAKLLTEDAKRYKVGEISQKTGLQKCLVNGNIVWLLPGQNSDYLQTRMQKSDAKQLASSAKLARADGYISFKGNINNDAKRYLNYMQTTCQQLFNFSLKKMIFLHLFRF